MTVTGITGTEYQLFPEPFSNGGEGKIYRVSISPKQEQINNSFNWFEEDINKQIPPPPLFN